MAAAMALACAIACTGGKLPERARPDCDIHNAPCQRALDSMSVTLDIAPRPVKAMRELTCTVRLTDNGRALDGASVTLDFTMPGMYMGTNRFVLAPRGGGVYEYACVLPRCPSGGTLWRAEAMIERGGGRSSSVAYLFEVQ